jgi:pilus assembly protein CpaB
MQQRLIPVLGLALALSAGASFLVYRLISGRLNSGKAAVVAQVAVAVRDLPVGTLLNNSDVRLAAWNGAVPPNSIVRISDAVGRGVAATIFRGEPLREQRLAPKGSGAGLAPTIPVGKRAVAIRVNEIAGVSGFAVPGMRVDVVVQGRSQNGGGRGDGFVKTILQNVQVLSAGQKYQHDVEGKPVSVQSVNLLVSPEEAELLTLANSEAKLQLVLRNPIDVAHTATRGWQVPDLFPGVRLTAPRQPSVAPKKVPVAAARPPAPKPPAAIVPKAPPPFTIELWHGTKKSVEEFSPVGES